MLFEVGTGYRYIVLVGCAIYGRIGKYVFHGRFVLTILQSPYYFGALSVALKIILCLLIFTMILE